jgi:hypothetical protein
MVLMGKYRRLLAARKKRTQLSPKSVEKQKKSKSTEDMSLGKRKKPKTTENMSLGQEGGILTELCRRGGHGSWP